MRAGGWAQRAASNSAAHSLSLFTALREVRKRLACAKLSRHQLSIVKLNNAFSTFPHPNPSPASHVTLRPQLPPSCLLDASQMLPRCSKDASKTPPTHFPNFQGTSQRPPRPPRYPSELPDTFKRRPGSLQDLPDIPYLPGASQPQDSCLGSGAGVICFLGQIQ